MLSEHQLVMFVLQLCSYLVILYSELRCFYLVNMYSHQQVVLNQKECDELVLAQELFFQEFARPDSSSDWELNRPN